MQTIVLAKGQNADRVAKLVGGTVIAVNGNELLMVGADLSKLKA